MRRLFRPVITGATGVVGSYLTHLLIRSGTPVFLIGRPPDFVHRAKTKIRTWGPVPSWEQVSFADWPGESLRKAVKRWNPSQVIHSAAETSLKATPTSEIVSRNLNLVVQMMDLCHHLEIPRIDFISTAYTCGKPTERIPEARHSAHGAFRNPYEESKWRSEELLFSDLAEFPMTRVIHRPSLILPPPVYARQATPKAALRIFERLRALSLRDESIRCSIDVLPNVSPGFVHLTGFIVDAIEIFKKIFAERVPVLHYSSCELPPLRFWLETIMEAIPQLEITVGDTCEVGKKVLGDLSPYLQDRFEFDQSRLEAALGGAPYSSLPLSESYFQQLIGSLLKPRNNNRSRLQETLA